MSQEEGIVVNILGATVQELQENVMCVFILQLIGSEDKICEAEKQIDANGVIRERVEVSCWNSSFLEYRWRSF